jgi:hypothetical protein
VRESGQRWQKLNGLVVVCSIYSLEKIEKRIRHMIVYIFYLHDAIKGDIFLGTLPERRKIPQRITGESIINWGRKYFCKNAKDEDIFFIKTVFEESEKRYPNLSPP